MKFARIASGIAVEVISWDPSGRYPADWVWVECPENTVQGAAYDGNTFTNPPEPVVAEPETESRREVSPVEFKMLFTSAERIAINNKRKDTSTENETVKAVLDDWYSIVDDPRLSAVNLQLQSTIDGVNFLVTIGILTAERAVQVLAGEIQ
ncbi:hypothetical protein [Roseibium alexandrii]|uniref:Uncharacterized protein n=1 Tax=Roseibium alexandrii (strain DSM 17067 / NCIMB 14079 / DFL-11) TaxID=244592 RepID=A0A5E8H3X4_ROSAD|nr:hypothetical protein [Roseibium alexandrii]EEE46676.1 hypothetical protein SADFL11_3965 [Roseibium alexandrii DFL-11]